jgi:hypothetical protein
MMMFLDTIIVNDLKITVVIEIADMTSSQFKELYKNFLRQQLFHLQFSTDDLQQVIDFVELRRGQRPDDDVEEQFKTVMLQTAQEVLLEMTNN